MTNITSKEFGTVNGTVNTLYTLSNGTTEVDIMTYGATIVAIRTPDKNGNKLDVLCGYDCVEDYMKNGGYLGAIIGRSSNRIANGEFILNENTYKIGKNEGNNNLHGGPNGFDTKMWDMNAQGENLVCKLKSLDMEAGFPGNVDVTVTYSLCNENGLGLEYYATTDADTIVNLTNHSYFNLNGQGTAPIIDHKIKLYSDFYTPVDDNCCPTGEVLSVKGTVFDLREFTRIGDDIDDVPDFAISGGFDHNFVLNTRENKMALAAEVLGDVSGIKLQAFTTKPAIQFYAGNMMDKVAGKGGAKYDKRYGLCLETQFIPNCMAHPHLGSAILRKGEEYHDKTVYKFSVE